MITKYFSRLSAVSLSLTFIATMAQAQSPVLDAEQTLFLQLINQFRAQNGAGPLQVSPRVQAAAQWMSEDMAAKNYFSHTDSLGRDPFQRMADFGYSWTPAGENIAAGYFGAQSVLDQWAASPGHRANMLNRGYKVIGIGRAYNAASPYRWYWTTNFGGYVDGGTPPDPTQPPTVSFFSANPSLVVAGQVTTLSWNVSGATSLTIDNGVGDVTGATTRIVVPPATTTYRLTARNNGGTTSAAVTVTVQTATVDREPPTAPPYVSAIAVNSTQVDVSWGRSTDNFGVTGYQLMRDGLVLTSLPSAGGFYSDRSVLAGRTYVYAVRAYDVNGNFSSARQAAPVTTPGSGTPSTPARIIVQSGSPQTTVVNTPFASPLQVKVLNVAGQGMPGIQVTFAAPASGASAAFSGGVRSMNITTDASGVATSPLLYANGNLGSYLVTASVSGGITPVAFGLTNIGSTTPPPTSGALSIWGAITPSYSRMTVAGPYEFGMKFRSDVAGKITGIRFFKIPENGGVHTGSLWTGDGQLLATGTFVNETPSGWQTLTFSAPVPIAANQTYLASYHTQSGIVAAAPGYFSIQGGDNGTLHALRDGVSGPNGVATYSSTGTRFPTWRWFGTNFWIDVLFLK